MPNQIASAVTMVHTPPRPRTPCSTCHGQRVTESTHLGGPSMGTSRIQETAKCFPVGGMATRCIMALTALLHSRQPASRTGKKPLPLRSAGGKEPRTPAARVASRKPAKPAVRLCKARCRQPVELICNRQTFACCANLCHKSVYRLVGWLHRPTIFFLDLCFSPCISTCLAFSVSSALSLYICSHCHCHCFALLLQWPTGHANYTCVGTQAHPPRAFQSSGRLGCPCQQETATRSRITQKYVLNAFFLYLSLSLVGLSLALPFSLSRTLSVSSTSSAASAACIVIVLV